MTDITQPTVETSGAHDIAEAQALTLVDRLVDGTTRVEMNATRWRAAADAVQDPFTLLGRRDYVRITELRFGGRHCDVHLARVVEPKLSPDFLPVVVLYRSSLMQLVARNAHAPFDYFRGDEAHGPLSVLHRAWDQSEEGRDWLERFVVSSTLYAGNLTDLAREVHLNSPHVDATASLVDFAHTLQTVARGASSAVRRLEAGGGASLETIDLVDQIDEVLQSAPTAQLALDPVGQALVAAQRRLRLP